MNIIRGICVCFIKHLSSSMVSKNMILGSYIYTTYGTKKRNTKNNKKRISFVCCVVDIHFNWLLFHDFPEPLQNFNFKEKKIINSIKNLLIDCSSWTFLVRISYDIFLCDMRPNNAIPSIPATVSNESDNPVNLQHSYKYLDTIDIRMQILCRNIFFPIDRYIVLILDLLFFRYIVSAFEWLDTY